MATIHLNRINTSKPCVATKTSLISKNNITPFAFTDPNHLEQGERKVVKSALEDNSFDVVVLDPPYIHSGKGKHITEKNYRGSTIKGLSITDIWKLYEQGMAEACRIVRPGGRILVKTQDTIESGRQRWTHIHLHNVAVGMDLYMRDLMQLFRNPPCETRWAGLKQRHSRKCNSYLLVLEQPK